MHNKTSSSQIKKLMIIETGDEFDSLLVSESERLIRTQPYIRDAIIIPHKNELNQTIDLEVRVLDNWSILIGGGMSETNTKISITEKTLPDWDTLLKTATDGITTKMLTLLRVVMRFRICWEPMQMQKYFII